MTRSIHKLAMVRTLLPCHQAADRSFTSCSSKLAIRLSSSSALLLNPLARSSTCCAPVSGIFSRSITRFCCFSVALLHQRESNGLNNPAVALTMMGLNTQGQWRGSFAAPGCSETVRLINSCFVACCVLPVVHGSPLALVRTELEHAATRPIVPARKDAEG